MNRYDERGERREREEGGVSGVIEHAKKRAVVGKELVINGRRERVIGNNEITRIIFIGLSCFFFLSFFLSCSLDV